MPLNNKVALVTGAAQGLGRSIALALAGKGARLGVNDMENKRDDLNRLVELIRTIKGEAIAVLADVTDSSNVFLMANQIINHMRNQNYGRIINIASVVGLTGIPGTPYYCGQSRTYGLDQSYSCGGSPEGITVNAIACGYV